MPERRKVARWSTNNQVNYRRLGEDREHACMSQDINAQGIRLNLAEELPANTALDLQIQLAEGLGPVFARGRVVWQSPDSNSSGQFYNTGIYFDSIKEADKEEIYKYAYQYKRGEITNRWFQGL